MSEVKAGQWWRQKSCGVKILVLGVSRTNMVVAEYSTGHIDCADSLWFQSNHEHLPECTGWDWEPEVYPQYRETECRNAFAFFRLDSPTQYTSVDIDGTESTVSDMPLLYEIVMNRTKLTEAEALARIVKPRAYPQYRETYEPDEFAFVRLDSPIQFTYVRKDGTEDPPDQHQYAYEQIDKRTEITEAEALAKIVKPEPAKIRTVKVHTVLYGVSPQLGRFVMTVLDSELNGFKRDWKYVQVLKTEEYEVPCE